MGRIVTAAVLAVLAAPAGAQPAPSTNYASFDATPGAPTRLGFYGSAHKNCTPAPPPQIHVLEAPKAGVLTIKQGELSTNRLAGCGVVKTTAEVVFYEVRDAAATQDRLVYRVDSENGEASVYNVTISIKSPVAPVPGASPTSGPKI